MFPSTIKGEVKLTTGGGASLSARELEALTVSDPRAVGLVAVLFVGGDRELDGHWTMVDAADFHGRDAREKMLSKFKGRFYIAKSEPALLKLEAEAIDTVSFGLVLARLEKGARFTMEKTKVNGELWMPVRMKVDFDARLALFKKMKVDLQIDYTNFRKFQSESRVLSQE